MKKIIFSLLVLVVCLFSFVEINKEQENIALEPIELADIPDDYLTILGTIVLENGYEIHVYNAYYMKLEIHHIDTFIYDNELLKPEVGALVKRKTNEEHWTVYKTYSLVESCGGSNNG